jgi:hypothetical protein
MVKDVEAPVYSVIAISVFIRAYVAHACVAGRALFQSFNIWEC